MSSKKSSIVLISISLNVLPILKLISFDFLLRRDTVINIFVLIDILSDNSKY